MTSESVNKNDPTEKPISEYLKLDKNVIEPQKFANNSISYSKHRCLPKSIKNNLLLKYF